MRKRSIPLVEEIRSILEDTAYEIIFIDDGSMDNSLEIMMKLKESEGMSVNQTQA